MAENHQNDESGFKVQDRRRFNADGSPVEAGREEAASTPNPEPTPAPKSEETREIPADFSSLVLSLAASAQAGLGLSPHPLTGKPEKNPAQAKYSIDLLGMLEEKTRGNLSGEEAKLLQAVLYDLRMRFLEGNQK